MIKPAINAPSSGDMPIAVVPNVVPIQINNTSSIYKSLFFVFAASLSALGTTNQPTTTIINANAISLVNTDGKMVKSIDSPPNRGANSNTSITAIS